MNNRSGLSLFELLVALALLALISTGLAGALGLAVNVWDRSATLAMSAEEVAVRSRLRILLRNATPPSRLTSFPNTFKGSVDELSFVTLAETAFASNVAALRVVVLTSGTSLSLSVKGINDEGIELMSIDNVLAANISPRFSYYDASAETIGWQDSWEDGNRLPDLVRIQAPEGSTPEWPEFVVRLRLD